MMKTVRLSEIDFLRGIAVILVLFRHYPNLIFLQNMGWIGVDLFFVLSGFLVSGLLYKEFIKDKSVQIGRFLIRRGFKIYPVFYLLIILTIAYKLYTGKEISIRSSFGEIFFLQNYVGSFWNHTWSLAVEEHFYIFLSLLFYFLSRRQLLDHTGVLISISIFILLTCTSLRFYFNYFQPNVNNFYFSHLRIDSLFTGVLLSHLYHFHRESLYTFVEKYKKILFLLFVLFISFTPFIVANESFFVQTIGFSLLYFAFGILLLLFVCIPEFNLKIKKYTPDFIYTGICKTGYYSYSIYIIHIAVAMGFTSLSHKFTVSASLLFPLYFCGSILSGILISKLIEQPFIKMRDKHFPSKIMLSNA